MACVQSNISSLCSNSRHVLDTAPAALARESGRSSPSPAPSAFSYDRYARVAPSGLAALWRGGGTIAHILRARRGYQSEIEVGTGPNPWIILSRLKLGVMGVPNRSTYDMPLRQKRARPG